MPIGDLSTPHETALSLLSAPHPSPGAAWPAPGSQIISIGRNYGSEESE